MATVTDLTRDAVARLQQAGITEADLDARALVAHALGLDRISLALHGGRDVSANQFDHLQELLSRREAREPLAHIVGERGFWSLTLSVSKDVLDPRPDSEVLIEQSLKHLSNQQGRYLIADVGTGSGALLLALLAELPGARGLGLDISQPALEVARQNAARNQLQARAQFRQSSWLAEAGNELFDLIISNPPYIASSVIGSLEPEVRDYEPRLALDGGPDGLDAYRALIPQAQARLKQGGMLCLEIGFDQQQPVMALMQQAGFARVTCGADLGGNPRCVSGIIT